MSKQKSLKLNFIMNIILTMSSFIFPLITFPYVSRILLPEGTGKVSFAMSVVSYFAMFAQLGIPTYGIRVCAKVRDDRNELTKIVQELFIINIITTIIVYVVLFVSIITIPRFKQDKVLFLIVSSTLFFNAVGMEWLYKALEQYTYITIRSIIFKFIALVFMFLLVHEKNDYVIYGGISIFASSASNVFNFINVHKYIRMRPVGNYNFKRHIKPIIVFFLMSCATTIYTNLDTIMLGFMKTNTDVGYYNAAVKNKYVLATIVSSLGAVLLPRASYYVEKGMKEEFNRIMKKAIDFVWIIATPLMVNFILIPSMASVGAAIGTLIAEAVVTTWQYISLKDTVTEAYKEVKYIPIFLGIILGTTSSIWIKALNWHEFPTLVLSAILFFGVYLLILTITKEPLTIEIEKQLLNKIRKNEKN